MSDQANWCKHEVRDPEVCNECFPQPVKVVSRKWAYAWTVVKAVVVVTWLLMAATLVTLLGF